MSIDAFVLAHGASPIRRIEAIEDEWRRDSHRRVVNDFLGAEVFAGLTVADALIGDGLRDQISPELLRGFSELMGKKADSYHEVRQLLLEKLDNGEQSVLGLIVKIQGQIGENHFIDQAYSLGLNARLADSGSQKAWDVAIDHSDGTTEYIQVKTYSSADNLIDRIKTANEQVLAGEVTDGIHAVDNLSLAVPADIAEQVAARLAGDPALETIKLYPMEITASEAAGVVREGFDNVGPEALQHLFGQIAGPLVAASAIAALVSAVMIRKQIIRLEEAIEGTLETTAFTASGLSISLAVESVLSSLVYVATPAAVVAGIGGRILIKRWYSGRQSLLESLREENADLSIMISRIFLKPHSDKHELRQHQARAAAATRMT